MEHLDLLIHSLGLPRIEGDFIKERGISMRKWFFGLILGLIIAGGSLSIYAAPPGKFGGGPGKFKGGPSYRIREDARHTIHRTVTVLFEAKRVAERRHRYFGMARAIAYQRKAKELYMADMYRNAIFYSLRARELTIKFIRENRGRVRPEFSRDEMEERYARESPGDNELDVGLDIRNLGSDDEAVRLHFDIDISN